MSDAISGMLSCLQMDNVTKDLKTNNMKLKGLVESVSYCCVSDSSQQHLSRDHITKPVPFRCRCAQSGTFV